MALNCDLKMSVEIVDCLWYLCLCLVVMDAAKHLRMHKTVPHKTCLAQNVHSADVDKS